MQITEAEKGLPLVNPIIIIRFYLSVFSSCLQCLKKIDEKKNKWSPHLHVLQKPKHCMLKRVREWKINEKDEYQWCEPRAPLVTPFIDNCCSFYPPSPFHLHGIVIRIEDVSKITIERNISRTRRIFLETRIKSLRITRLKLN